MNKLIKPNIKYNDILEIGISEKLYSFIPDKTTSFEIICSSQIKLYITIYDVQYDRLTNGNYLKDSNTTKIARTMLKDTTYFIKISSMDNSKYKKNRFAFRLEAIVAPKCSLLNEQWGIFNKKTGIDINIMPVWRYINKSNIKIGVLDTGVKYDHPNLINNINTSLEYNFVHSIKKSYDLNEKDSIYSSIVGHGTYISGIITAQPKNGIGVIGVVNCENLVPLKVLGTPIDEMNIFNKASDAFALAIDYAKKNNIRILNCSFGGKNFIDKEKELMAQAKDILFVLAAGNDSLNLDYDKRYPACYNLDNAIVVGAIDSEGELYENSNYGSFVDIVAPGVDIVSTHINNRYIKAHGTSSAAAFISGICCLMLSLFPSLKPYDIKRIITNPMNVTKLPNLEGKIKSGGLVNAYQSIITSQIND